ncbi:uncharacterized protein OCT59_029032 [Rhizophagus irregularis]|nr:hypothetical protein OCT59_029032 [Rhizophagus irregularis]
MQTVYMIRAKISHASQEILANKVQLQRKKISKQNQIINILQDQLQQKVEDEKEAVSDDLGQIAQEIANRVTKNEIDISSFSPIFQELIRIQCNQATKGIRYHPMFLRWAISVYSRGGLLWSQRDNRYVGYLDFEDEKKELQSFMMKCEKELQEELQVENLPNSIYSDSYYGINTLTAHEINKILFQLAANLKCLGIHTCGSICDGAGENRNHIKSFDWWTSFWCLGDIVEVNIGKNNYEKAKIMATNLDHSKFTVRLLDPFFPDEFQVNRNLLRQPMPNKLDWKINDSCEFKNPEDNKWHLAIITNIDKSQTFFVTILSTKKEWKVAITSLNLYIRLPYNSQIHWMNHKTINPITGTPWYFISDPTHVFKKLRNNLSKSHIGEGKGRNIREIMIDGKEVSWRHVQGVYDYSCRNKTAKISRLTKRHIWLTSWSKMRVDLAEQTLSKDVENAMEMIDELKEISAGTREFINYSYLYRQIFHSKKPLENLADSRLQTLKEIRDWFVIRDNQKTSTMNWISPQCQFDLLLSIQGFLDMVKDIFTLYPDVTIEPCRVSQDMLEGLFGTIRQLGRDSSTQTLKGYGYALNKFQITSLVTAEMKSVNYGTSNHTEMDLDYLS